MLLVRHGESTWNFEHRIQGQLDPPLSIDGRVQAERLGGRLAGRSFARFYTSDLRRAAETAEVIGAAIDEPPEPVRAWREIYLGEWEGLTTAEIAQSYPDVWAKWTAEPDWDLVPGGEGAAAFERRVGTALDELFARHQQDDVLVVTHGGVIQIALYRILGRPSRGLFKFKIQNASITVIEQRGGRLVIAGVNDTSHLEPALVVEPGPA